MGCKNSEKPTPQLVTSSASNERLPDSSDVDTLTGHQSITGYLVLDKRLSEMLINGNIPEDFPRQKELETIEIYADRVITWGRDNEELIKEQYRENLHSSTLKNKLIQKLKHSPDH